MQQIHRLIQDEIVRELSRPNAKVNIIYGARQVGKTTLAKSIIWQIWYRTIEISGDEIIYRDILSSQSRTKLESLISGYEMIFIDEAQRIENIGINLKILHDSFPNLKILVTGSSSFDLSNKIQEPLTGRARIHKLYPLSLWELGQYYNYFELEQQFLEDFLIFGSYPDILLEKNSTTKRRNLEDLSNAYLYKDILLLEHIRYPEKLFKLLKLLAFQVGNEVSLPELSNQLDLNRDTLLRYIHLLEQAFIIYRLSGFSRNLRKEVTKSDKIYFWDLGVRNILIQNLNGMADRGDIWALWENFLINERLKSRTYQGIYITSYFWRTYTGAEIDYIEESNNGRIAAYEFKWGRKTPKAPKTFLETYSGSEYEVVSRENYLSFVL